MGAIPTFLWPFIAGMLAFAGVLLAFAGAIIPARRDPLESRLHQYAQRPRTLEEIELQAPIGERLFRPMLSGLTRIVARLAPSTRLEATQKRIIRAGLL